MQPKPRYQPGDKIGERYQVHQALMGGMGEVYLCLDLETIKPIALKTFQRRFSTNPRFLAAFKTEVATWVALEKHPNIVRCYRMATLDNLPFMFLEWVASYGRRSADLRGWLRHGPLDLRLALDFTIGICRGLIHAQQKQPGIVHRDLKPDNVLVSQGRIPKITDFGLAKVVRDTVLDLPEMSDSAVGAPRLSHQGGTYQYMAPEQWMGLDLDQRTDIYSLGCVLYELLMGHWPYSEAITVLELRHCHLKAAIPLLPKQHSASMLNEVLVHCLAKRREERFDKVECLSRELTHIYQQQFTETPEAIPSAGEFGAIDYADRAATYLELGRHTEALTDSNHAINLDSNLAQAYTNRGVTYRKLRRYQEALADFDRAIEMAPFDAAIHSNRGIVYTSLSRYEEALAAFERAVQLDPFDAQIYANRACVYIGMRQNQKVLTDCNRAIQLDPSCVQAFVNRGTAYAGLRRYEDALADYSRAAQIAPYHPEIFFSRGVTYYELHRYEDALADYSRVIQLDSTHAQAFCNRGVTYQTLCRFEEALSDFDQAIQLEPTDVFAYRNRAMINHELGRYDKALADLSRAIQLVPNNASDYLWRGLTYISLERREEALTDLKRAIQLDPTDATAYFNVGVVFANTGKWREALPYYEKADQLGLSEGGLQASEVKQRLALEAFITASSYDEMQRAVTELPFMLSTHFATVLDQKAEQLDSDLRSWHDERVMWLRQIANEQR